MFNKMEISKRFASVDKIDYNYNINFTVIIMYILKLQIATNNEEERIKLCELYAGAIAKMNSEDKNNPHKDSGFDIYTPSDNVKILSGGTKLVDMKIRCAAYKVDEGGAVPTAFFMFPRSSIYKTQLRLANNTGIIDSGYRGNLMGAFDNISRVGPSFPDGVWCQMDNAYGRLLQICMPDLSPFTVEIVDDLDDTSRGAGGFGSTGV
jgi:dUTP pyrophosphatase